MSHKRKPAEFMKNADIRAGKIPGWPGRPETNGDPFDPNNMDRCDAHIVVNEGTILIAAAAVNAGKQVKKRQVGIIIFIITLVAYALLSLSGAAKEVKAWIKPDSGAPAQSQSGQVLAELISEFYLKSPVAKDYELKFLVEKFGWSANPQSKPARVVISKEAFETFSQFSDEKKAELASSFEGYCTRYRIEINDCMRRSLSQYSTSVAAYLNSVGEDVSSYLPGAHQINDDSENKLADFLQKFPRSAPSYCDSENRLFAESWPLKEAQAQGEEMNVRWVKEGKLPESAVIVGSMKELINHRIDGDQECKNLHIAALEVGSGAIEYIVSIKGRHNVAGKNKIFTKLYFLADLNGGRKPVYVACANCKDIEGIEQSMESQIVAGLNQSANGVIEAFADSNMKLAGE